MLLCLFHLHITLFLYIYSLEKITLGIAAIDSRIYSLRCYPRDQTSLCNLAISGVKYFTKVSLVRRSGWPPAPLLPYLLLLRIVVTSSRLGGAGLLAESMTSLVSLKATMASGFFWGECTDSNLFAVLRVILTCSRAPAHVLYDFWPHQVILHW